MFVATNIFVAPGVSQRVYIVCPPYTHTPLFFSNQCNLWGPPHYIFLAPPFLPGGHFLLNNPVEFLPPEKFLFI